MSDSDWRLYIIDGSPYLLLRPSVDTGIFLFQASRYIQRAFQKSVRQIAFHFHFIFSIRNPLMSGLFVRSKTKHHSGFYTGQHSITTSSYRSMHGSTFIDFISYRITGSSISFYETHAVCIYPTLYFFSFKSSSFIPLHFAN